MICWTLKSRWRFWLERLHQSLSICRVVVNLRKESEIRSKMWAAGCRVNHKCLHFMLEACFPHSVRHMLLIIINPWRFLTTKWFICWLGELTSWTNCMHVSRMDNVAFSKKKLHKVIFYFSSCSVFKYISPTISTGANNLRPNRSI